MFLVRNVVSGHVSDEFGLGLMLAFLFIVGTLNLIAHFEKKYKDDNE